MRHQAAFGAPPPGPAARVAGGVLLPVFTVLSAVWFSAAAIALLALWQASQHAGLPLWQQHGWSSFAGVPLWVIGLVVIGAWALVALPIGAARRAALHYANGGRLHGWADAWSGLLWLVIVGLLLVAAWQLLPQFAGSWFSWQQGTIAV